ncbi:hypothetical protein HKX48_001956 [Thoreauomyces humboldtii]|nr:hypothetical protein HKX48_001956 [Thoreauomyces humboldtii]
MFNSTQRRPASDNTTSGRGADTDLAAYHHHFARAEYLQALRHVEKDSDLARNLLGLLSNSQRVAWDAGLQFREPLSKGKSNTATKTLLPLSACPDLRIQVATPVQAHANLIKCLNANTPASSTTCGNRKSQSSAVPLHLLRRPVAPKKHAPIPKNEATDIFRNFLPMDHPSDKSMLPLPKRPSTSPASLRKTALGQSVALKDLRKVRKGDEAVKEMITRSPVLEDWDGDHMMVDAEQELIEDGEDKVDDELEAMDSVDAQSEETEGAGLGIEVVDTMDYEEGEVEAAESFHDAQASQKEDAEVDDSEDSHEEEKEEEEEEVEEQANEGEADEEKEITERIYPDLTDEMEQEDAQDESREQQAPEAPTQQHLRSPETHQSPSQSSFRSSFMPGSPFHGRSIVATFAHYETNEQHVERHTSPVGPSQPKAPEMRSMSPFSPRDDRKAEEEAAAAKQARKAKPRGRASVSAVRRSTRFNIRTHSDDEEDEEEEEPAQQDTPVAKRRATTPAKDRLLNRRHTQLLATPRRTSATPDATSVVRRSGRIAAAHKTTDEDHSDTPAPAVTPARSAVPKRTATSRKKAPVGKIVHEDGEEDDMEEVQEPEIVPITTGKRSVRKSAASSRTPAPVTTRESLRERNHKATPAAAARAAEKPSGDEGEDDGDNNDDPMSLEDLEATPLPKRMATRRRAAAVAGDRENTPAGAVTPATTTRKRGAVAAAATPVGKPTVTTRRMARQRGE